LAAHLKRLQQRKQLFQSSMQSSSSACDHPAFSASSVFQGLPQTSRSSDATLMTSVAASMSTESVIECVNGLSLEQSTDVEKHTMVKRKDVPLFTIKQVGLVCERMMKEREEKLQEEYDQILTAKLSEQYEAFLKFNQDQLHRQFGESAASYVS